MTLRAVTSADYERQNTFRNDLQFELDGGGTPPRPQPVAVFTEEFTAMVADHAAFTFAIAVGGLYVGNTGLFDVNRVNGTAQLGIGIGDAEYRGKGYGREAIGLLLGYGFQVQNLRRIWLGVHGPNERAQRCYRAVGFVEEARLRAHVWRDGRYVDEILMGLLREEWTGAPS